MNLVLAIGCGDPVDPAITADPPPPVDDEFDAGSGIASQTPTSIQIQNLALLAKVWGFAKYHHPLVVGGSVNWDYELFRAIPPVLAATDSAAEAVIVPWLDSVGVVPACSPCVASPSGAHLLPENGWISDTAEVGATLSGRLISIHQNRPSTGVHRYVTFAPGVGNPVFSQEQPYATHPAPDAGFRLLALFRFWNIIQYWFPYRDVMDEDWGTVLEEFIPLVLEPLDGNEYRLAMIKLTARVHDSHANLWSDINLRPPTGTDEVPVFVRSVEDRFVVFGYSHETQGPATGLEVGDAIHRVDGIAVETLVDSLSAYYGVSNEATLLRDIGRSLTRGFGPAMLGGVGPDGAFEFSATRMPRTQLDLSPGYRHDLPGSTFQMLDEDVAYLKLSSVVAASAASYIQQAQGAEVLVIDIRNYPSEFVVFALGQHLVSAPTDFARFTVADPTNPGAFTWTNPVSLTPRAPHFDGDVVILVDEVSQSQAEYTTMAFRVAPDAIVVGSTTAGADGNVSNIPLPGDLRSMISGIGVFYPDRTPTQRIGIIPDLVVRPTIAGIREGRDEVLEAGVSNALGREFAIPKN